VAWAAEGTDSYEHQLALLLALKSYQRMGCFPKREEIPDMVADFVRRVVELLEGMLPVYASERTAQQHRTQVRRWTGVAYDGVRARALAQDTIRAEAASKNNPPDLINVALEKLVESGYELPAFSTWTPWHRWSAVGIVNLFGPTSGGDHPVRLRRGRSGPLGWFRRPWSAR
jgi:hypothetical protein